MLFEGCCFLMGSRRCFQSGSWLNMGMVIVFSSLVIPLISAKPNVCANPAIKGNYLYFKQESYCNIHQKSNTGPLIPCVNINHLSKESSSLYPYVGQVKIVSDDELWEVLYNNSVKSFCALVLFYAANCPFSSKAAATFNALGRIYHTFPVLAVDVHVYSRATRDYIIAYYPSIVLYYDGKVAKRFDPLSPFEKLCQAISDITGIPVGENASLISSDVEGPLHSYPLRNTDWMLLLSLFYLIVLSVYFMLKYVC